MEKEKISIKFSRLSFLFNFIRVPLRVIIWKLGAKNLKKNGQIYGPIFDYITTEIILDGRFENNLLACLETFFKNDENFKSKQSTCIDIGANIGNHSLFFSKWFKKVISFEPHPVNFKLLAMNTYGTNIEIHNLALSDVESNLILNDKDLFNSGAHTISNVNLSEGILIRATRLDRLISDDKHIDLIKIDVEGHEVKVLKGALNTITRCRPTIIFEQSIEKIDDGTSDTIGLLKEMGYTNFYYLQKRFYYESLGPFINIIRAFLVIIFGDKYVFIKKNSTPRRFHDMVIAQW
jgi:FkbM family methyltransferase